MFQKKFDTVNKSNTVLMEGPVDIRTVELTEEGLVHQQAVVGVTFTTAYQHVQLVYHLVIQYMLPVI